MSQPAQAVRPKPAAPAPEVRARRKHPRAGMLTGTPRYLRATVRLGGVHDPEEHDADRAATAIAAGSRHQVHDPGGARSLRAAAANTDVPVRRSETCAAAAHGVVDLGGEGRIRRTAAPAGPGPADPVRGMAHAVVDPGAEGRIRRHLDHKVADPGGMHSLRAMPAAEPTRATGQEPVRGEAESIRRAADGGMHGRDTSGEACRDPDAEAADHIERARGGVGHPLPPAVRARLEHGFGETMAGVRVDTSHAGRRAAAAIGARAYTEGARITLGHGESEHDLRLMAHEAAHVVQNRRRAEQGAIERGGIRRREVRPAEDADSGDDRTYRMHDGRVIELPDDMTREEAAKLEAEGEAAKRRLGKGPPPKPVPEVHKPADRSKAKKPPPKRPPKHAHGHARHPGGPRSVGAVAKLHPVGGPVGHYLIAKAVPVLVRGIGKLATLSRHEQTHNDAGTKIGQAEKAVVIPPSEGQSKSNTSQVGTVSGRPAPPIDENKGKDRLQESLAENVPKTIEDVDNFKRDRKAEHTGAEVLKVVQADKNSVVTTFADMEHTPSPTPPEHPAVPLPPIEAAPPTAPMNLGQGAVPPLLPEHTDVSNYTKEADDRLKQEGITQEQLDMVDSGDLAAANKEKKGLEKSAQTEPQAVRNFARDEAGKADTELKQQERTERSALSAHHRRGLGHTAEQQKHAKSKLEKKRDEVAAKINGIYQTAQDSVKKKLADLETQAMKRFDDGNANASKDFEDTVKRELDAYKDDRYSGVFGWARKAKDWLLGMDDLPKVKAIFERNRQAFVDTLNKLVADISADNKRVIQECKDELAKAKADIKQYVDKLGPELKDIANKTATEVNGKLNELDGFIRKQEEALQKKLADKQQKAIQAIDDKIAKMKEAMSGALAKLGQLLLWAAKKFFKWALGQFGYSWSDIEAIIDRGVAILKAIVTKPIQFVKNLIAAAKQGFLNFGKNFLSHLKDALFDWLTGSLEGLQLPDTWDLKGIASVALQLLGLTWANIRGKLVKRIGEKPVKAIETGFDLVVTLVRDGPIAAWEKLQDMGAAIKEAFASAVKDFILTKIVTEAIKTIIAIFVPGAGIVKAIIAIYDTVVFFIQKAKQIAEMVGNFLGAIGAIAAGNIQVGADALEKGLATALKLVINFLARFLHLDAITAKIRNAIRKIHDKVDGALERVADWVVEKGKGVLAKLFGKKEDQKGGTDGEKEERLRIGIDEAVAAVDHLPPTEFNVGTAAALLAPIKAKHGFQTLEIVSKEGSWWVHGTINPSATKKTHKATAEELQLLDDGKLPIDQRRTVLSGVRALTEGTKIVPFLLDQLRSKAMTAAQALAALYRISSGRLTGGYRIRAGLRPLTIMGGRYVYAMDYYGPFPVGNVLEVAYWDRKGEKGGDVPVGWAYVKPVPDGPGGATPIPSLALDFFVPVPIENLGMRGIGVTMFNMGASYYNTRYQAVVGEWYRLQFYAVGGRPDMSQNLIKYLAGRRAGEAKEVAVTRTWTYNRVKELYGGKLTVEVTENIRDINNVRGGEYVVALLKPAP